MKVSFTNSFPSYRKLAEYVEDLIVPTRNMQQTEEEFIEEIINPMCAKLIGYINYQGDSWNNQPVS